MEQLQTLPPKNPSTAVSEPGAAEFRVRFSLGKKILLGVAGLLFLTVLFLNISSILLFQEDKRAYVFQSQSTAGTLAGREAVSLLKHSIDTLRLSLGSINPTGSAEQQNRSAQLSVIGNQSDLIHVSTFLMNSKTQALKPLTQVSREAQLKELGVRPDEMMPEEDWLKIATADLAQNGTAFVNLSRVGGPPLLGVFVADTRLQSNPSGMPVALGILPLKEFGSQLAGIHLTISTLSGWILFATDSAALYSRKNISQETSFKTAVESKVASGTQEFTQEGVRYLGSYVKPGLGLVVLSQTEWRRAMKATFELSKKFGLLGVVAIGLSIIAALLFSKTLTAPLGKLYEGTRQVAQGNFNIQIAVPSKDEIGALTGSFNRMSRRITELVRAQIEKAQLEQELAIASTVQQTLIPPAEFSNDRVDIRSYYQSASQCGGDWWGFFGVGNKLAIMVADATGHGFPSALITASARSCFSVMHKLAQDDPEFTFSPSAMLSYANRVVYDASLSRIMMTFFVAVIDFENGTLTYSNAGHNPPWLFSMENGRHRAQSLIASGPRLGESRETTSFEERTLPLNVGDLLFLYTDGLTENRNESSEAFGKTRARKAIEANLTAGPERVITSVVERFLRHKADRPLDDDVTFAAVRISSLGAHA